ncbi:MAG: YceI family protein [Limisphaerales bacterium]
MKPCPILTTVLAILSLNTGASADSYKIDPVHSSVGFSVRHMVISKVKGKFNEFTGTLDLDDHNALTAAAGVIQTKSVDTGVAGRDRDLRSPNFFDVEKYPTIAFQSKRVEKKGDQFVLVGDYTMHGVTKELSLPATLNGPIKDAWGNNRIGLEAKTKVSRTDYGMTYNKVLETGGLVVGDEIEIEINAEAVKAAPKSP